MSATLWAVGATAFAAVASALPSGFLLMLSSATRRRMMPWLVAFAAGALLGAALVDLLPEAFAAHTDPRAVSGALLVGLLGFFLIDLVIGHRHGHEDDEAHGTAGAMVLAGDALHNFIDGIAIAAAFAVSTSTGIATTLAVLAHEVPQEVGNLAVLIDAGWPPRRAFIANLLVQLLAIAGALVATWVIDEARAYVLAVSCASFLYVSVADLIPSLQRGTRRRRFAQGVLLIAGAALIAGLHAALG